MRVSVLIATFNRAALLDECLNHLSLQQFRDGDEVIVVDNGSTDSTAAVITRYARMFPVPLRRLEEERPGKSIALARAVAVAAGDVFAFTDDDVNVGEGWVEELRHAMAPGKVGLVGGPVRPRWERTVPQWLSEAGRSGRLASPLALLDYGSEPIELGPRTVLGANMAVRRDVMQGVGGFAAHLGKLRGTLLSGEDHEFCRRVQAAGFKAMYHPSAIVHHWVPASRVRVRYFLRWFFWSGITNAALDAGRRSSPPVFLGVPRYLVRRFGAGVATAPVLAMCGRTTDALNRAVDAAFAAGYAAHCWGLTSVALSATPSPAREPA